MKREFIEYLRRSIYSVDPNNLPDNLRYSYEGALYRAIEKEVRNISIFDDYVNNSNKLWAYRLYAIKAPDEEVKISDIKDAILNASMHNFEHNGIAASPEDVYKHTVENRTGDFCGDVVQVIGLTVDYLDDSHAVTKFGVMVRDTRTADAETFVFKYEAHCVRFEEDYIDL